MILATLLAVAVLAWSAGSWIPASKAGEPGPARVSRAPRAIVVAGIATDGAAFPAPGVIVTVPCGDPLVPLGRQHRLPPWCRPTLLIPLPGDMTLDHPGLAPEAQAATVAMFIAARAEGLEPVVASAFRSFEEQEATFSYWVATVGEAEAERMSARPGHSEHQLGTTVDLTTPALGMQLVVEFAATPEGAWLREHAPEFGFVLSYPEGTESVTGYTYEPWHFRYVGAGVARDIRALGLTAFEYLLARRP